MTGHLSVRLLFSVLVGNLQHVGIVLGWWGEGKGMLGMACFAFTIKKPEILYILLVIIEIRAFLITHDQDAQKKKQIKHSEGVRKKARVELNLLGYFSFQLYGSLILGNSPSTPSYAVNKSLVLGRASGKGVCRYMTCKGCQVKSHMGPFSLTSK